MKSSEALWLRIKRALSIIDGYFDVPTKDATTDTTMRDVIGKKDDTTVTTVGTTKTIIAYVKGIITLLGTYHAVPAKDATTDVNVRDVVGKKDDTAVEDVGTTKTVIAYSKGIVQEVAQRDVAKMATAVNGTTGYVDCVNVTDKGVLTGISQCMERCFIGSVKVVIDSITVYDGVFALELDDETGDPIISRNSLAFNHRFDTSLQVQHKTSNEAGDSSLIVSYTTD